MVALHRTGHKPLDKVPFQEEEGGGAELLTEGAEAPAPGYTPRPCTSETVYFFFLNSNFTITKSIQIANSLWTDFATPQNLDIQQDKIGCVP